MEHPPIVVNGIEYIHVKTRHKMPVSVYKGPDTFLRIGPKDLLQKEIAFHRSLIKFDFPVAKIIEEGEHEGNYYYIENSLGGHFSAMFSEDIKRKGVISDALFRQFMDLVRKYAEAELQTLKVDGWSFAGFKEMIHVENLFSELPALGDAASEAMKKVEKNICALPGVLSNGDFNPYNIFEKGVTDWERGCYAPLGYDLVTNITQFLMFPARGDYEFIRSYSFTREQWNNYFHEIEGVLKEYGVPELFRTRDDFIFCRSIWSLVRMHNWPNIQQWRYDQFEKLLHRYLNGGDIVSFLFEYSDRD